MSQPDMQDIQQKRYVLQMLKEQIEILESQIDMLSTNFEGIQLTLQTLKGLEDTPDVKEKEVIVPLGANAFTKAKLLEPNKIMLFIKNDIVVEKTLKESIESLENMSNNNKEIREKIQKRMQELNGQVMQIGQSLQNNR